MKKIAIVGFGWLGFPLGKSLKAQGFEVKGSTTTPAKVDPLTAAGLSSIVLDVNDVIPQESTAFFENTDICILNIPPGSKSDPQGLQQDITAYGQNLTKIAGLFPAETKFIFIGSTGIYPENIGTAFEDDFDRTQYTDTNSLANAEEQLYQLLGTRLTIVRMSGLIGGERHIGKHFAGRKHIPNGDSPVNLVHLEDCIQLIERIIATNDWGNTYNGCATGHPSRRDFYTDFCQKHQLELPEFPEETDPVIGKKIDNSKSKTILGVRYRYDDPFVMN